MCNLDVRVDIETYDMALEPRKPASLNRLPPDVNVAQGAGLLCACLPA